MRPSLSGRSHSLYSAAAALYRSATAMYRAATALYRSSTAFCRYAGFITGSVHILGPHLSPVLGALLPLHYSSIAALLRRRPRVQIRPFFCPPSLDLRVQIRPFCPRRSSHWSSRVQIVGFCPRRFPNCSSSMQNRLICTRDITFWTASQKLDRTDYYKISQRILIACQRVAGLCTREVLQEDTV